MDVAIEYKIREPRTHNYLNTIGNTILTVKEKVSEGKEKEAVIHSQAPTPLKYQ